MASNERKEFHKLSKSVSPSHYDITLQPDLDKFVFHGTERIDITVVKATKRIIINCLDIVIESAIFINEEGTALTPKHTKYNEEAETVQFAFAEELAIGCGKIEIVFNGVLNEKLKGFYRSAQAVGENKQYAAVTHFEPTDARRAFPCWDEPALKCTFDITLVVPKDKVALSNMIVVSESEHSDENLKIVKFATTPKMSTYIIAFIVGDFDYIEDKTDDGIIVRVYTSTGKAERGRFALKVATETLMFYQKYFGIPYGLEKIDLIGVADFGIGAMENWGLVTYRERYLLVDELDTSTRTKQRVAEIIGHELAHNWFGNLVTMEWWTHLWLKEGFANFIEYLCVNELFPEYDIWSQFVISENIVAQNLDALGNSHPVEVPVGHPSEVDEIFDRISYSKGASILRMLHQYMGTKSFQDGLHKYLTKYQFSNTVTEDLWEQLELVSRKPIGRIMSTWTEQMGFPVVSVSRESIGNGRDVLKLTQSKFSVGHQNSEGYKWMIPINISSSEHTNEPFIKTLMSDPDMVIYLDNISSVNWIKLNPGQTDYYRVKYSEDLLQQLIPAIQSKSISNVDRLGIQNDLFAMACAGYASTVEYLNLLNAYSAETDFIVWADILSNLKTLTYLFERTDSFDSFKSFVLKLVKPVANQVGFVKQDGEGPLTSMLRAPVLSMLGNFGEEKTVSMFKSMFSDHVNDVKTIDTDLRQAVYSTVVTHGNTQTLKEVKQLYAYSNVVDERSRLLQNMGRINNNHLREQVLEFSISEDVRNQDTLLVISGCLNSHEGRVQTWEFVKEHWHTYQERCIGGHARSNLIKISIELFATAEELQDVKSFLSNHHVGMAERTVKQSIETIRNNIEWINRLSSICSIF